MYEELSVFERALARFGDKVGLIAGLEIADKMSPEQVAEYALRLNNAIYAKLVKSEV